MKRRLPGLGGSDREEPERATERSQAVGRDRTDGHPAGTERPYRSGARFRRRLRPEPQSPTRRPLDTMIGASISKRPGACGTIALTPKNEEER